MSSALSQLHIHCVARLLPTPHIICMWCAHKTYLFLFNPSYTLLQGTHIPPKAFTSCHDRGSNLLPPDGRASTLTTQPIRQAKIFSSRRRHYVIQTKLDDRIILLLLLLSLFSAEIVFSCDSLYLLAHWHSQPNNAKLVFKDPKDGKTKVTYSVSKVGGILHLATKKWPCIW